MKYSIGDIITYRSSFDPLNNKYKVVGIDKRRKNYIIKRLIHDIKDYTLRESWVEENFYQTFADIVKGVCDEV